MCGIVGLYAWPGSEREVGTRLEAMCESIRHRGPDDAGTSVNGLVALGNRRLSIIDVAGGHQPIHNEDGGVAVVFNGEIYNYRELRADLVARGHQFRTRTDTETLVHAYEERGTDCLGALRGIFAVALWDASRQRLMLARDRMGVKPLYLARYREGLAFGSEIKALLTLPELRATLDLEAAAEFFRLGYTPPPRTLFRGIQKLPPGWLLVAEGGGIRSEPYWDLEFGATKPAPRFEDSREELRELLRDAVGAQMVGDVPLGAFLSGGVDSTAVVAFMRQHAASDVQTFSIGFDAEHSHHDETAFAQRAARALGTRHETLVARPEVVQRMPELVEKLDEPLTDSSFLVTHLVSELASRSVKVALSGLGGDELFGGYRRYAMPAARRPFAALPPGWRRSLGSSGARLLRADRDSTLGNLGRYAKRFGQTLHLSAGEQYLGLVGVLPADRVAALLRRPAGSSDPGSHLATLHESPTVAGPLDRLLYVDAKTVLPESLLLLSDKMSMANSLEVRVPLLDDRLVEFACRIPGSFRLKRFQLKRLLKASLEGLVPDFVLTRQKRGFEPPIGAWLRDALRPWIAELLEPERLKREGLFDPSVVQKLLAEHETRREDHTEPLMGLLTFQLWRERFGVELP